MTNLPKLSKREIGTLRCALATSATANNNDGLHRLTLDAVMLYNKLFPREPYPKYLIDNLKQLIAEG